MIDNWILKILLTPLAILYGIGVSIHQGLYSLGLMRGLSFSLPVISIGNLSVGGTGKTPHTEYLLRLLHDYIRIGVLSRGYRRKSTGYLEVDASHDARTAGDEPLQYKRKFPDVHVAVAENRSIALSLLVRSYPDIQLILLDDGFQHREIEPGLNIMLTAYHDLYTRDWLLPIGRLREWRNAAVRADVIIVTKCPSAISAVEMNALVEEVQYHPDQQVFFSKYIYGHPYKMYNPSERIALHEGLDVFLITGIAESEYLLEYIRENCNEVQLMEYGDHHPYSATDIENINRQFKLIAEKTKPVIITTEKDAVRLDLHREVLRSLDLPIFILPLKVEFMGDDPQGFDEYIKEWLLNFKR